MRSETTTNRTTFVTPPQVAATQVAAALRWTARGSAVVAGFAIPISTSVAEIALVLTALAGFLAHDAGRTLREIRGNRVAVACVLLFLWLCGTLVYTVAPLQEGARVLLKYRQLVFVPAFLLVFRRSTLDRLGTQAFVAGVLVTLAASYLMWFGLFETKWGNATNCAVFKSHITQNVLTSFTVYLLASSAVHEPRRRWLYLSLCAVGAFNVLFLVDGRSGYVVLAALGVLFAFQRGGYRGLLLGLVAGAAVGGGVYLASSNFRQRVDLAVEELHGYYTGTVPVNSRNSIGTRMRILETSLSMAARRPLFGYGIGGFRTEYARVAKERGIVACRNPHNEYVMMQLQGGLVAVVLLLVLLGAVWRSSWRIRGRRGELAQAVVVTIAVGCLVNSLLLDTTEGNFFAFFVSLCFADLSLRDESS